VQLFKLLVYLGEILYGGDDDKGNIDSVLLNLAASAFQNGGHLTFLGDRNF
jgi:hypothetical protein